jgi:Ran GTPase-activating protein (RanGAP) involved in mRNA processing and transport
MRNCNLQPLAGLSIGKGLRLNRKLEQLLMAGNSLGDQGMINLAEGIPANMTLKILELRNNKFENEGALPFLESMLENR